PFTLLLMEMIWKKLWRPILNFTRSFYRPKTKMKFFLFRPLEEFCLRRMSKRRKLTDGTNSGRKKKRKTYEIKSFRKAKNTDLKKIHSHRFLCDWMRHIPLKILLKMNC